MLSDPLGLFALFIIGLLFVGAVCLIVWLGALPARIASRQQHPQVNAINAMSWLGLLLTGGIGWALALVWALVRFDSAIMTNSTTASASKTESAEGAEANLSQLESRVAKLEQILAGPNGSKEKS